MKKKLIYLAVLGLICAIVVVGITVLFKDHSRYNNDFTRILPPHALDLQNWIKLDAEQYALAGMTNTEIFLGNSSQDTILVRYNLGLTTHTTVPFRTTIAGVRDARLLIDSPSFFLFNGYTRSIEKGMLTNWGTAAAHPRLPFFSEAIPITDSDFAITVINRTLKRNVIGKASGHNGKVIYSNDLLTPQTDGIFSTDGMLAYSKELNSIIHVYRYRNEILVLDENLNIKYKSKTIDTTSIAKISVTELNGDLKLAAPPLLVNKQIVADGKYLYVNSNLIAKNENKEQAEERNTIDVYDMTNGSYLFSFYIYNFDKVNLSQIAIKGSHLVALHGEYLSIYKINFPAKLR